MTDTKEKSTASSIRASLLGSLSKAGLKVDDNGAASKFVESSSQFLGNLVDDGSELITDVTEGLEEALKKVTEPKPDQKICIAQFQVEVKAGIHLLARGVAYIPIKSDKQLGDAQIKVATHVAESWGPHKSNPAAFVETRFTSLEHITPTESEVFISKFDVESSSRFFSETVASRIYTD